METIIDLNSLPKEAVQKLKNNGVKYVELIVRNKKNKRFKEFIKVAVEELNDSQDIKQLINNSQKLLKDTKMLNKNILNVKNLQIFNSLFGIANLCATTAGFIIVCNKLDGISKQIEKVSEEIKTSHTEITFSTFKAILEEHQKLLDGEEGGLKFDEERIGKLISSENVMLDQLYFSFINNTCNDDGSVLTAILTLSSILEYAICKYDYVYYYNHPNKKSLYGGRDNWIKTYKKFLSVEFKNKLEDYFFLEEGLNQYQTDILVQEVKDEIENRIEILNNNKDLLSIDLTKEDLETINNEIDKVVYADACSYINEINISEESKEKCKVCLNKILYTA